MSKILQGTIIVLLIVLIVIMWDIREKISDINYSNELNTQYVQLNKIISRMDDELQVTTDKLYNIQLYLDEIDDILNDKFYGKVGNYTQGLTK